MRNKGLRMCVVCKSHKVKNDLIRIVKQNDKETVDETYKAQTRGFYVCKDSVCIERFNKNKKYDLKL